MGQTQTLELLLEAGRLLSSKLDLAELLQSVIQLSAKVVDAETASLLLHDPRNNELYFDVALGLGEAASKVRLKMGQGIAGSVAKTLQPAVINDVAADARWSPAVDAASGFKTRSILAVPMRVKGQLIGVVEAINKRGGGFTEEDARTLEGFASQAAAAIENARLFASLKEERFKLRTVFMGMSDGAMLAGPDGFVLLTNDAARRLLGIGDAPATTVREALKDLALQPPLDRLIGGDKISVPFTARREKPKPLVLTGSATRTDLGWIIVFRDDTENAVKEQLKRSFLSLISHKLKTPLASVTGYADILQNEFRKSPPGNPVVTKACNSISTQGAKLADLVDKLLRYTTLDNPESTLVRKPCAVDALIDETIVGMKEWLDAHGAEVARAPGPALTVVGDAVQLREVVKNLVENAVKFDDKPKRRVAVAVEAAGAHAVVSVTDQGPGIPPEDQEKVFSRFHQIETYFTGQVDGWGLGLPYVKKVVEGHGGAVEIHSKLGQGTTVRVRLPLQK